MSDVLPDEMWSRVLEMGVSTFRLGYRDLCSLSITSRLFHRLSADSDLWACLLSRDYPPYYSSSPSMPLKSLYKDRFDKDMSRKRTALRLDMLNVKSQIATCSKNITKFRKALKKENAGLKAAVSEHARLEQVRRASVALNVWQPEVVSSSRGRMVAQCSVPIECRLHAVEVEIRVYKRQIADYTNSHKANKQRLCELKEKLASLKYHPLHSFRLEKEYGME